VDSPGHGTVVGSSCAGRLRPVENGKAWWDPSTTPVGSNPQRERHGHQQCDRESSRMLTTNASGDYEVRLCAMASTRLPQRQPVSPDAVARTYHLGRQPCCASTWFWKDWLARPTGRSYRRGAAALKLKSSQRGPDSHRVSKRSSAAGNPQLILTWWITSPAAPPRASRCDDHRCHQPGRAAGRSNVNGQRSMFNNFMLDGMDNNAYGESNQGFRQPASSSPPDSIAQFEVVTQQ